MKKQKNFNIEERANGDIFCNNVSIEILGDSRLKINEDVFDKSDNFQSVSNITTGKPLKRLIYLDTVQNQNIFKSLIYQDLIPTHVETKPGRYKSTICHLNDHFKNFFE